MGISAVLVLCRALSHPGARAVVCGVARHMLARAECCRGAWAQWSGQDRRGPGPGGAHVRESVASRHSHVRAGVRAGSAGGGAACGGRAPFQPRELGTD